MRQRVLGWVAWGAFLFQGGFAVAQSSLQTLEQELKDAKQLHQDTTAQVLTNFFSQIDAAMGSPDAAVALYQQAGGTLPDPAPVVTAYSNETASEKEARLAVDQANKAKLGAVLQLHCGLMHYAALFVVKPDQKGLQDDWVTWLKSAAQTYPQLNAQTVSSDPNPPSHKRKSDQNPNAPVAKPFNPAEVKGKAMRESIISKYLAFKSWADKEQGGWSVRDLPKLYRATVLEPLRTSPTTATLSAWDTYITMMNADEPDNDRWNQSVYPPLQFDRACDAYAAEPSTEKLEALVALIKANPTYPQVDDWISRAHQLLEDYSARHGGKATTAQTPATTSSTQTSDPKVSVTTEQQGDATIITTHTNSAPVTNAPPAR
jgi:hypothetical protein